MFKLYLFRVLQSTGEQIYVIEIPDDNPEKQQQSTTNKERQFLSS